MNFDTRTGFGQMKQRGSRSGRFVKIGAALALTIQTVLTPVALAQGPAAPAPAAAKPPVTQPAPGGPRTLADALALAYSTNPTLLAQRANVRAVDENVPAALAGWRPTITVSSNAGFATDNRITHTTLPARTSRQMVHRGLNGETITATQQLYSGGATKAATNRAENQVMAERGRLLAQEQATLLASVQAYVGVIQTTQLLALNVNNEQVLSRQLQATNDRFRVGELTRTDVAQAEAALAGAAATRQTAEGNLQTARATFRDSVGALPGNLIEPQPLKLPIRTLEQAQAQARTNNPTVVAALFDDAAAKDSFDAQFARLMPTLNLQASYGRNEDTTTKNLQANTGQILAILSLPLYQGGVEYAAIRQARQAQLTSRQKLEAARGTAVQQLAAAWSTHGAAKAAIESTRQQVRANEIALEGVQREALVGSRTTLDVLNAEQALLTSRTNLVQNLANLVTASYQVASGIGRLNARDLALNVPLYDETAYYKAVRNRLVGTSDYATDQPAR
ncbi:MAG: TolC family outer membrane protein [Alphaproteobacteria bacterium]|nr:TolC family outer membrane protein [Alphaproteobacteria bacterium]